MKNSFERFDNFIDKILGERGLFFLIRLGRYLLSMVSMALLVICTAHFIANGNAWSTYMVRADLQHIVDALSGFDSDCGLQKLEPGIYSLDFLTLPYPSVDGLAGFTVRDTQAWQGPYFKTVPVVDGRPYVLLSTAYGLFVTPSYGVRLPNGKKLGKDVVWNPQSDIEALVQDDAILSYQGEPLARKFIPQARTNYRANYGSRSAMKVS